MPPYKNQLQRLVEIKRGYRRRGGGEGEEEEEGGKQDSEKKQDKEKGKGKEKSKTEAARKPIRRIAIRRYQDPFSPYPTARDSNLHRESASLPSKSNHSSSDTDNPVSMVFQCIKPNSNVLPPLEDFSMEAESNIWNGSNFKNENELSSNNNGHFDDTLEGGTIPMPLSDFMLTDILPTFEPASPALSHTTVPSVSSGSTSPPYYTAEEDNSSMAFQIQDDISRKLSPGIPHLTPSPTSQSEPSTPPEFIDSHDNKYINSNRNTFPAAANPLDSMSSQRTIETSYPSYDQRDGYNKNAGFYKNTVEEGDHNIRRYVTPMQRVEIATLRGGHRIITDVKLDVQQVQQIAPNMPTMRIAIAINTTVPPRL